MRASTKRDVVKALIDAGEDRLATAAGCLIRAQDDDMPVVTEAEIRKVLSKFGFDIEVVPGDWKTAKTRRLDPETDRIDIVIESRGLHGEYPGSEVERAKKDLKRALRDAGIQFVWTNDPWVIELHFKDEVYLE